MIRRRLFFSTPVAVVPIEVSPTSRTVSYGSGSFTITVKAQGNWSLTCNSSYLSFDKTSGSGDDTVTVTYSAVSAGFTASIVFELTSGEYIGEQATCKFTEEAYVPPTPTEYSMTLNFIGKTLSPSLKSTFTARITCDGSTDSYTWSGTGSEVVGQYGITSRDKSVTVSITGSMKEGTGSAGYVCQVDPSSFLFIDGGSKTITLDPHQPVFETTGP